jgi:tetratricopeptide (TPR) repeat protein
VTAASSWRGKRALAWLVGLLGLLDMATPVRSQVPPVAGYRDLVAEATREFSAGNFEEARTLFEQAHAAKPSARTLRGLGLTAYELRRYVQAVSELQAALADTRNPLTGEQQREVQAVITMARRYVARLTVELVPAEASLLLNGTAVKERDLALGVGDYTLTARAAGYRDASQTIALQGGQTHRLRIELVPVDLRVKAGARASDAHTAGQARDSGDGGLLSRWWFWAAAGAVVVGGVVAGVVLLDDGGSETTPADLKVQVLRSAP